MDGFTRRTATRPAKWHGVSIPQLDDEALNQCYDAVIEAKEAGLFQDAVVLYRYKAQRGLVPWPEGIARPTDPEMRDDRLGVWPDDGRGPEERPKKEWWE